MKDIRRTTIVIVVGLAVLAQLMNPTLVHAEGEVTPQPSETPVETATSELTEVPTDVIATESSTPDTLPTTPAPTDPVVDTLDPTATDLAVTTQTDLPTDVAPTESSTVDPALTTPISNTAVPSDVTPTDLISATVEPVETSTPIPPTDSPETTSEPTESAASTPGPVETAILEETVNAKEPALSEVLQKLPADTTVVVLDENSQALPLASQAAVDVIAQADPMWCPDGVAPGGTGCTGSYSTMADLLANEGTYINSHIGDGTIWITSGNVGDINPIVIDGLIYTTWANYALTLQGGWNGTLGTTTIGSNSVFSVPITIANWNSNVTINNITNSSRIRVINDPWGSTPNQIGNVTIDNVIASRLNVTTNSSNNTIHIRNSSISNGQGAYVDGWLNSLIIENSHFDNNAGDGLLGFNSWGGITITNSTFNGNGGSGASMNYAGDLMINNSTFNGNLAQGANISNASSVTISNSFFSGNNSYGTSITNAGVVSIESSSDFSGNGANGVSISQAGDVTIKDSTFNNNMFHGIYVIETSGNITLGNITATADPSTQGDGAYLDNTWGSGNVTLTGTNDFSNHNPGNSGMYILSNGHVELSGITSNNNGRGVNISQAGSVTITSGIFNDNVCDCEGSGAYVISSGDVSIGQSTFTGNTLYVNSAGNVTIQDVTVDRASGFGLGVETAGGNVTINNSSFTNTLANENNPAFPWGDGADIVSNGGNVTVSHSEFTGNAFDGLYVVNAGDVLVDHSKFNNNQIGGLDAAYANKIDIKASEFTANGPYYDLFATCYTDTPPEYYNFLSLFFDDSIPTANPGAPTFIDILVDNECSYSNYLLRVDNPNSIPIPNAPPPQLGRDRKIKKRIDSSGHDNIPSQSHVELFLCWGTQKSHRVNLPNGDKVEIVCPVNGKASISRLDNTTLPGELPAGYTFASAFQVEISQLDHGGGKERSPIKVITEGGFIKASFVAPLIQTEDTYSILYWDNDNKIWIPLKDFLRDANGLPHIFNLHSENSSDPMQILRGVEFISRVDHPRVEVSTNFPGTFVLALH